MSRLPIPALLMSARQAAVSELHERLRAEGHELIREGHGCVFGFIQEGGSRLTYLAEQSGLTKQAVGEVVDDLQRLGYVERIPDPSDGRAKLVRLTAAGADARERGRSILDEIEQRWADQIGEERMATMREALEELHAAATSRAPAPA